eukprot:g1298.t1
MALLERFYDPSSGMVSVDGQDMRKFKISSLRRCIGYVGQEPVLFSQSIRANIMQGNPEASKEQFQQACADAQLGFVENLPEKYNTFVGAGGGQLSGGQKQRIALARALLKESATSALDNTSEKMIQQILGVKRKKLVDSEEGPDGSKEGVPGSRTIDSISSKGEGTRRLGIVSIAHRLSTIRNSDLIYVLSRGEVVEQGNHESLMDRKGVYYALVAAQESSEKVGEEDEPDIPHQPTVALMRAHSGESDESELARKEREKKEEEDRQKSINDNYKVPMSRLMSYNKPEWPFFVPAILGALIEGAAMPVCAVALVGSMDAFFKLQVPATREEAREEILFLCLVFLIIAVSVLVGCVIEHGSFALLAESMTCRLRVAILKAIFRQEIGFHDDPENTPGMMSKALEIWAFRVSTLCKSIGAKAAALSSVLVGLIIAFVYCWQMALVMLGTVPIMVAANAVQMLVMLGASKVDNEGIKHAAQIVSDSVMNARTVQALNVERNLVQMYATLVGKSTEGMWKRNFLAGLGFGIASGVMFFVIAGGFYYASVLRREGVATFSDTMMAFMGVFYAGLGAGQSAVFIGDAAKAKVACHDMFKLLDRASKIDGMEPKGEVPSGPTALEAGTIEFDQVKFFYPFRPEIQVLKGVNFKIRKGQSVGLEPVLFNTSVRNNILYGVDGDVDEEYIKKCEKMCNLKFLYKSGNQGLATEVGPRGSRLSGGQKQRVAICRALMRNPAVMLLDEATSALDSQSEAIVQEALNAAREGRTSFAIAHRLSTIESCDVILVNADGRVVDRPRSAAEVHFRATPKPLKAQDLAGSTSVPRKRPMSAFPGRASASPVGRRPATASTRGRFASEKVEKKMEFPSPGRVGKTPESDGAAARDDLPSQGPHLLAFASTSHWAQERRLEQESEEALKQLEALNAAVEALRMKLEVAKDDAECSAAQLLQLNSAADSWAKAAEESRQELKDRELRLQERSARKICMPPRVLQQQTDRLQEQVEAQQSLLLQRLEERRALEAQARAACRAAESQMKVKEEALSAFARQRKDLEWQSLRLRGEVRGLKARLAAGASEALSARGFAAAARPATPSGRDECLPLHLRDRCVRHCEPLVASLATSAECRRARGGADCCELRWRPERLRKGYRSVANLLGDLEEHAEVVSW